MNTSLVLLASVSVARGTALQERAIYQTEERVNSLRNSLYSNYGLLDEFKIQFSMITSRFSNRSDKQNHKITLLTQL